MTAARTDSRRGTVPTAVVAWALVAAYVAGTVVHVGFELHSLAEHAPSVAPLEAVADAANLLVAMGMFAVVGAVIVSRRPRHLVGWILLAAGISILVVEFGSSYARAAVGNSPGDPPTLGLVAGWVASWAFPVFIFLALVFLPLLYPDGRLPSRRWRPIAGVVGAVGLLGVASGALSDRLIGTLRPPGQEPVVVYDVANPVGASWAATLADGLDAFGTVLFPAVLVVAVAAVTVRFRRSRGIGRQQMKWFMFAVAAVLAAVLIERLATALLGQFPVRLQWLAVAGVPIAVGVAVLRYRLYEIDRIISRTVSYGLVVVVLGAVYAAAVVGFGAAVSGFTGAEGSDLVVAVSVLAVVALFRPVRTRVQRAVDRRFNRSGYEARLAVEAFTQQARDDVELEAITRSVAETAAVAVQPAHVSLWLDGDRS